MHYNYSLANIYSEIWQGYRGLNIFILPICGMFAATWSNGLNTRRMFTLLLRMAGVITFLWLIPLGSISQIVQGRWNGLTTWFVILTVTTTISWAVAIYCFITLWNDPRNVLKHFIVIIEVLAAFVTALVGIVLWPTVTLSTLMGMVVWAIGFLAWRGYKFYRRQPTTS